MATGEREDQTTRTRHIDLRFHFSRDLIQKKVIHLTKVSTRAHVADLLTKPPTADGVRKMCIRFNMDGSC